MRVINITNLDAFRVPLIYLCTGIFWILLGNRVLDGLTLNLSPELKVDLKTVKCIIFITVTSILLFYLVKQQQRRLLRSEKQYRTIFAGCPNPMYIFNVNTKRIVKVNRAAILKYGYSKGEFERLNIFDIRPSEGHELLENVLRQYKGRHEFAGTLSHMKKSGEVFNVSVVAHEVNFNNQDCIMVHAFDIDEQVKNEQKLQEAYCIEKELNQALENNNKVLEAAYKENRRLGDILDKINNMVIILDKEGRITWVNQAFSNFTGYNKKDVTGKSPSFLFGPKTDLKIVDELIRRVHDGDFFSEELINYTKDQKEYWVQLNVSPLLDDNGNYEGMISVENIINDRKESEFKIQTQNEALREIAWISSHQFRRPVASIVSISGMLSDVTDDEERQEYISMLQTASKELDGVSRDIACRINELERSCQSA